MVRLSWCNKQNNWLTAENVYTSSAGALHAIPRKRLPAGRRIHRKVGGSRRGAEESCQEVVEGCWAHSELCLPTRGIKGTADLIKLTVAQA